MVYINTKVKFPKINSTLAYYGWTYEILGKKINMSKSSVGRRMTGKVAWTLDEIHEVCKALDKGFNDLFR